MPDTTATPAPKADKPADAPKDDKATEAKTPETPSTDTAPDVEFDGPYDEERAKRKMAAQAADLKAAKAKLAEHDAAEQAKREADMTEAQKVAARAEAAEKRADEAERKLLIATVSTETGVPTALLEGSGHKDDKGLRAYAAELVAFRGDKPKDDKKPAAPGGKPKPGLKPGSGEGSTNAENDVEAIAARIKAKRRF